jgi:hypothetical protein
MSTTDELIKLDALRQSGALSQEEFDQEKALLLTRPLSPTRTVVTAPPDEPPVASSKRAFVRETPPHSVASAERLRQAPTGWDWVLIVAGALVAISSLLPWEQASTGFASINRNGLQLGADLSFSADGLIVMALGAVVALVAVAILTTKSCPWWVNGLPIIIGAIVLLFGIADEISIANTVSGLRSSYPTGVYSVGYGVWLVIVAGAIIVLAGVVGWGARRRNETHAAPQGPLATRPGVPAGWYPDSQIPGQFRYWDGTRWTGDLRWKHPRA